MNYLQDMNCMFIRDCYLFCWVFVTHYGDRDQDGHESAFTKLFICGKRQRFTRETPETTI